MEIHPTKGILNSSFVSKISSNDREIWYTFSVRRSRDVKSPHICRTLDHVKASRELSSHYQGFP